MVPIHKLLISKQRCSACKESHHGYWEWVWVGRETRRLWWWWLERTVRATLASARTRRGRGHVGAIGPGILGVCVSLRPTVCARTSHSTLSPGATLVLAAVIMPHTNCTAYMSAGACTGNAFGSGSSEIGTRHACCNPSDAPRIFLPSESQRAKYLLRIQVH